jgi:hypothetical protein
VQAIVHGGGARGAGRCIMGMRDQEGESNERLCARSNLAQSLSSGGKYAESERMHREVHSIQMRVMAVEHHTTLNSANDIATCLWRRGKTLGPSSSTARCMPYGCVAWTGAPVHPQSVGRARPLPLAPREEC